MECKIRGFETTLGCNLMTPLVISVEDKTLFRKIIESLFNEIDNNELSDQISFWDDLTRVKLHRNCDIQTDFYETNIFTTRIKNQIIKYISNSITSDYVDEQEIIQNAIDSIHKSLDSVVINFNLPIYINSDLNLEKVIKSFDINIYKDKNTCYLDNVYAYIDLVEFLELFDFIIMVNVSNNLDKKDYELLVEYVKSKGIKAVYLESNLMQTDLSNTIYIDNDYYLEEFESSLY